MNQSEIQKKGVEALKLLNNAVTTSRLYPPEAPQVANAVERGYTGIKRFLDQFQELEFSLRNDEPHLVGKELAEEILDTFPNLVIYRQLRLLKLPELRLTQSLDQFAFGQLLSVFNASAEKIADVGGGLPFITSLGLAPFFPTIDQEEGSETGAVAGDKDEKAKTVLKVRPELVVCLLGKDERPLIKEELKKKMGDPALCVEIVSAGVGKILQSIRQKRKILASPFFPELMKNSEALMDPNNESDIAASLATFLAGSLKETALCVLLAQDFQASFGEKVYNNLIGSLSTEKLGAVIVFFREQIAQFKDQDEAAEQLEFFGGVMKRLISSEKGKQFLSTEKAKNIIHDGEKARKKKRLEAGITALLSGRHEVLENEELLLHIPRSVRQLLSGGNRDYVSSILARMQEYLPKIDQNRRMRVVDSLAEIGRRLLEHKEADLLAALENTLIAEFRNNDSNVEVFEKTGVLLYEMMQSRWTRQEFLKGDIILKLFYQIRSKQINKPESFWAVAGKVQDCNIDRASLPEMLDKYLAAPEDEVLKYRLLLQGPIAVRFLVEALINAENSDDRLQIIDMLISIGTFLPAVVKERLPGHMPWYGKRNLIKLLGETGDEGDADTVIPYLQHNDFRVQREAFICIYKIGGKRRKDIFLATLDDAPALIQVQIIEAFRGFCDRDIAQKLGEALKNHSSFSSSKREKLLLTSIETLRQCGISEAHKALLQFLALRRQRGGRDVSEPVWSAAEKASNYLEVELKETRRKHLQASQIRKVALKQAAQLMKTGTGQRIITGLPQEQAIRKLLAQGDKETASKQLLDLIERTIQVKNIFQAEKLKDWLIEIAGSDFNSVIKAIALIEKEKSGESAAEHLDVWVKLYDALTTEEFAELFGTLIHNSYEPGEIIVSQGALQQALFFINAGRVKLYFEEDGEEVLIKTMERGQIMGTGVFFDASIWTLSVASVGYSDVSMLRLDRLPEWRVKFPELEGKLKDFCKQFEENKKILEGYTKDRRIGERHKIRGLVKKILLDSRQRRLGVLQELELIDIGRGGVAYKLRSVRKDNIRQLLGHKVQLEIPIAGHDEEFLTKEGDIIALKALPTVASYSVHIKFHEPMEPPLLDKVIEACRVADE